MSFLRNVGLSTRDGGAGVQSSCLFDNTWHPPIMLSRRVGLTGSMLLFKYPHRDSIENGSSGMDPRLEQKNEADVLLHFAIFRFAPGKENDMATGRGGIVTFMDNCMVSVLAVCLIFDYRF